MRYALTSQAGYLDEPWTKKVPDQPALFLVSLFFAQGGKERDPEEEELEGRDVSVMALNATLSNGSTGYAQILDPDKELETTHAG